MIPAIPRSLQWWFKVHFLVDILFALPLIIAPGWILGWFGFTEIGFTKSASLLARLVGAALMGIGGASLFTKTKEQFEIMLTLKIIWSFTAIIGLVWSLAEGAPASVWMIVVVFTLFSGLWMWYRWKR